MTYLCSVRQQQHVAQWPFWAHHKLVVLPKFYLSTSARHDLNAVSDLPPTSPALRYSLLSNTGRRTYAILIVRRCNLLPVSVRCHCHRTTFDRLSTYNCNFFLVTVFPLAVLYTNIIQCLCLNIFLSLSETYLEKCRLISKSYQFRYTKQTEPIKSLKLLKPTWHAYRQSNPRDCR